MSNVKGSPPPGEANLKDDVEALKRQITELQGQLAEVAYRGEVAKAIAHLAEEVGPIAEFAESLKPQFAEFMEPLRNLAPANINVALRPEKVNALRALRWTLGTDAGRRLSSRLPMEEPNVSGIGIDMHEEQWQAFRAHMDSLNRTEGEIF